MPASVLYPNAGAMEAMELIRTALAGCKVGLFQNDIQPEPGIAIEDLEPADFTGYVEKTVTALLPAYHDVGGGAAAQIATIQFDCGGPAVANTIFGFWVEDAGGVLWLVGRFEQPVPMAALGDSIPLDIKFSFANG